jgi:hypothetical protein
MPWWISSEIHPVSSGIQEKETVEIPIIERATAMYPTWHADLKAKTANESTTATALLSFALVLLDWSFVMAEALEIRKDPGLGDLTLKAT